ncbi:MAG: DUF169 domain-containing protein [Syntrophales bacterium]|jgi:uncharacterized protein (DUF169 family)|nr:DUF169 domain-containing protein [Syntrophales bacterium]MDY0045195.1 DUF169 domain-containing protein [Syntrophales bacterium]
MDLKQINDTLNMYIKPQTFPVAVKLYTAEEALPAKVRIPVKDLGYQIALCQAVALSRRYGWTIAVGKNDQCCIGGHTTMGFLDNPPEARPGDEEKRHEPGKYAYMVSAAIDRADFEPDMICLYVNSAQAMRLAQAAVNSGGGIAPTLPTGMGDCGDIMARTIKTDMNQFILPSGGDRVFGSTQDHEVIFTIPKSKVELMMKALGDTHAAGFRYPVLTDVRHRPNLAPFLEIPQNA